MAITASDSAMEMAIRMHQRPDLALHASKFVVNYHDADDVVASR